MKVVNKKILVPLIAFLLCFNAFGQKEYRKNDDRIKAQKVAFITERLSLTAEEAQNFWPIYNAFDEKVHKLRREDMRDLRKSMSNEDLSENEAQKILDKFMDLEESMHQAKKQLVKDLGKAIPPQKIIALKSAEDAFNRMLVNRLKQRREKMQEMKKNRN